MKHIFQQGNDQNKPTFMLLHGTGGTENDLLPVAGMIDNSASILGVRGNITENGMPRFFKRLAEGVFDEEDLMKQTGGLYEFIDTASVEHSFDRENVIAIGYSNGANIAANLLFHYEQPVKRAALFHPMVPRRGIQLPDLTGLPVFIGAGKNDPICRPEETEELAEMLEAAGAAVTLHWEDGGHQLTREEVAQAAEWYKHTVL
ncbi:carboxylesterase [Marinococcus halophilus]|uniref:Phospholipase/carboxylesterase n=1 Tax=Marinococcus halophilus TaxID=1371 RepID=A0A510Y5R8_MARHA|nr:alpha/beta hydrolase [Marinococcus halophilus]OZT79889.1 carboxylesterase [Marinococcus halophilus]GEK58716.1 phospholipase/carboxylesterase [Marinococcus halophilus]